MTTDVIERWAEVCDKPEVVDKAVTPTATPDTPVTTTTAPDTPVATNARPGGPEAGIATPDTPVSATTAPDTPVDTAVRADTSATGPAAPATPTTTAAMLGTNVPVQNPAFAHMPGISLNELLGAVIGSRWLIASIVIVFLLGGIGHVLLAQRIYRADALVLVEETAKGYGTLADRADLFEEDGDVGREMELLKSRRVISEVVDNLNLDVIARPLYLPWVGAVIARLGIYDSNANDSPQFNLAGYTWNADFIKKFGLDEYAWGDEIIEIGTFDVPASFRGKKFTLVADDNDGYRLLRKGARLAHGVVGELKEISLANGERLTLLVSQLRANPGTRFVVKRRHRLVRIGKLQKSVTVRERGKQSGLIGISLEGTDPENIRDIINELLNIYMRQNLARKSAEAASTLNFLDEQVALIKQQMESAEASLNDYRREQGAVDLPRVTQTILQRIVTVEAELSQLNGNRQELLQKIKPRHPRMVTLNAKIATLNQQLKTLESKLERLPDTQQEVVRLSRDVEVNTQLYTFLLDRVQELKVVKAGPSSNVQIVDYAVTPRKPVRPNEKYLITVYVLLGLLVGVAAGLLRNTLLRRVDDPGVIENQLGLPVYAVVPHSARQKKLFKRASHKHAKHGVLAATDPNEPAVESLRGLRVSLHSALLRAKSNVVLITSPAPSVGKSFISANLGAVLASANNRVLILDGDLRKGHLDEYLDVKCDAGLSDFLAGQKDIEDVIQVTGIDNLSIVSAGPRPRNPAELLLHDKFALALRKVSQEFDHVIIDTPPILAVADAAIMGRLGGAALLVVKAGTHPLQEIEQSVKRLNQAGVSLSGVVFNDIKASSIGYGRYFSYTASYCSSTN